MATSNRRLGTTAGLAALCAFAALFRLGLPFALDYNTQDIFRSQRPLLDILLHRGGDPYHPELSFLLLHVSLWLGRAEWLARLPSALSAVAAVAVFHRLALAAFDPLTAAVAGVLLALHPDFLAHAREVDIHVLFACLTLIAFWTFTRAVKDGRRGSLLSFGVGAALALCSDHYAVFLVPVFLLSALLDEEAAARRLLSPWAWAPLALAAVPFALALRETLPQGLAVRRLAAAHPGLVWGDFALGAELRGFVELLLPGPVAALPAALAAAGAWRWLQEGRRRGRVLWTAWLVLPLAAGAALTPFFRVRPYYFLFVLPAACALIASGLQPAAELVSSLWREEAAPARAGSARTAVRALAVLTVAAAAARLALAAPALYGDDPRADIPSIVARIQAGDRGRVVAFDPHFLHTLFVYYSARDPFQAIKTCEFFGPEAFVECRYEGWRVLGLTNTGDFAPDWDRRSLERLERLASAGPFWLIEDPDFVNARARDFIAARCRREDGFAKHALFLCGGRNSSMAAERTEK